VGVAGEELVGTAAAVGVGVLLGFDNVFTVALGVTAKATTPTISSAIKATPATVPPTGTARIVMAPSSIYVAEKLFFRKRSSVMDQPGDKAVTCGDSA
jgi:hypothetical protein